MKKIFSMVLVVMLVLAIGTVSVLAASFDALDQYDTEKADGSNVPWGYYYSADNGATFELMEIFQTVDWGKYWYPFEGSYVGVGLNNDAAGYVEMNTSDNNADFSALGFIAPADGEYKITGKLVNLWTQTSDKIIIKKGSEVVAEKPFPAEENGTVELNETITLAKGDVVYFYGTTTAGWLSTYADITVAEAGAEEPAEAPADNPDTGDATSIVLLAAAAIIALGGLVVFGRKLRIQ